MTLFVILVEVISLQCKVRVRDQKLVFLFLGLVKHKMFKRKIVNIFFPISFTIYFGPQKNRLIETVLLSTHNICFG